MSSTLPYLQRQLKPRLLELAAQTDLQGYKQYTKADLAAALDDELRDNQSRYARNALFSEFYKRMARASTEVEATPSSSRRSPRRTRSEPAEESDEENESSAPSTPPRRTIRASRSVRDNQLDGSPMSPRLVAEAVDQQTERMRQRMSEAWSSSGMTERSDSLRSTLSSVKAVEILFLVLEGACVMHDLVPMRYVTTVPAVEAIRSPEFALKVPDAFILVSSSFWAPYSLWLLTSLLIPLAVAYFFNLSLKTAQGARSRGAARSSFDPLSFNIAKALVAYRVYGERFTFWDVYSRFSVNRVNASLPGNWAGVVTGSAIAGVGTLYEAILRK